MVRSLALAAALLFSSSALACPMADAAAFTEAAAKVDQASGATVETLRVTGFPAPTDIDTFAFAAWGGELWAFVRRYGVGSSTDVYQIDASGRMTVVATRIGINAVGAGVSTCASTD
jgi:hypothetical protein